MGMERMPINNNEEEKLKSAAEIAMEKVDQDEIKDESVAKTKEILENINDENIGNTETIIDKQDITNETKKENIVEEVNTEELAKKYLYNGELGYISGKLSLVPENIRSNKEFMMEAISGSKDPGNVIDHAGENLKNDKEFALYAMSVNETNSHNDSVYEKLSPNLQGDKDVVLAALKAHTSLDKIPPQFKDKETVLFALQEDDHVRSLKTIPSELLKDKDVIMASLENQGSIRSLSEFPERYRNDREFVLKAIKNQPYNYFDASGELKNNPEVAFEAIKIDSEKNRGYSGLAEKLSWDLKSNKEFMKKVNDLQQKLRKSE